MISGTRAEGKGATNADGPPAAVCEYGICMVDSTTATFSLGQFADDPARSRLRTLLAQQLPVEILMEKVACGVVLVQVSNHVDLSCVGAGE